MKRLMIAIAMCVAAVAADAAQCEGLTQKGERCKREADEGSKFCIGHADQAKKAAPKETAETKEKTSPKEETAPKKMAVPKKENAAPKEKADREFDAKLNELIGQKGGKNAKAIKALLKIDELKESKNQDADITSAIEALAKDENSNFLFSSKEPIKKPVAGTGGQPPRNEETKSLLNALKEHYKQ